MGRHVNSGRHPARLRAIGGLRDRRSHDSRCNGDRPRMVRRRMERQGGVRVSRLRRRSTPDGTMGDSGAGGVIMMEYSTTRKLYPGALSDEAAALFKVIWQAIRWTPCYAEMPRDQIAAFEELLRACYVES